jgi:hypothetical protein
MKPGLSSDEAAREAPRTKRDYRGLIILGALGALEVVMLYALIALETPLTPIVQRLLGNAAGVFVLVMWVVSLLVVGMWAFTTWAERTHQKRSGHDGV